MDQQPKPTPQVEEGEFSLDDIDKILAAEDPSFSAEMADLRSIETDPSAVIESINYDQDLEDTIEKKSDEKESRLDRVRAFVYDYQERFRVWREAKRSKLNEKREKIKVRLQQSLERAKEFFRHELPERLRFYRARWGEQYGQFRNWLFGEISKFKALSGTQKSGLIFSFLASVAALIILLAATKSRLLPQWYSPLVRSLTEHAEDVYKYKSKADLQDLFRAFPEAEFYVLLTKVVVNLQPDENSGPNPMGLYEVYLGLDSKDTAIEVKDREKEILDIIQRGLEPYTYSEVSSRLGKDRMKGTIKEKLNEVLNQGQVFRVYFNNFVTKP